MQELHNIPGSWMRHSGASGYVRIVCFVPCPWLNPVKREGFPASICISALKCDPATFLLRVHSRRIRYWSHFTAVYASKILKIPKILCHYLHVHIQRPENPSFLVDTEICATSGPYQVQGQEMYRDKQRLYIIQIYISTNYSDAFYTCFCDPCTNNPQLYPPALALTA